MRSLAVMLGFGIVTSLPAAGQAPASLSGIVRDENGAAVREVLIVIDPDSLSLRTRTDADGRYRIAVPTGTWEARFVRIGYKPQSHTINVAGPAHELNVTLVTVAIPLSGIAVRVSRPGLHGLVVTRGIELLPHDPRPLRDASIEVLNEPHRIKAGADGRFSIPQLAIGSHTILVSLDRYATRMVPVTIPPEGGLEMTFTLDSLYADYQFRDQQAMRDISWRIRRANTPATFVSAHEIDSTAANLRESLRFAHSVLSRGIILMGRCAIIYVDGRLRPDLQLQDIPPADIQGVEVYPEFSLKSDAGVVNENPGTPKCGVEGSLFSAGERARGSFSRRATTRSQGNRGLVVMIWTRKR